MVDNHSLKIDAVPVTLRELALTKVRQAIIAGYFKAGDRDGRDEQIFFTGKFHRGSSFSSFHRKKG